MQKNEHRFEITKQVRFFTWGNISHSTRKILLVLHGYGQHPEFFLRHFQWINDQQVVVVAPEGPHRFYTEGFSGRVGASWMTKEDRLSDIKDHINYLNGLIDAIKMKCAADCELHVFGFSQGVATATRWLSNQNHQALSLTCWAGSLPTDISYGAPDSPFRNLPFWCFIGKADDLVPISSQQELFDSLRNDMFNFVVTIYDGGHQLVPESVKQHLTKILAL